MTILKPKITEKTLKDTAFNRYTFLVSKTATKGEIKTAVEDAFKVNVIKVTTITGKPYTARSYRTGRYQTHSGLKKATVQLKPKQTIKYFETK